MCVFILWCLCVWVCVCVCVCICACHHITSFPIFKVDYQGARGVPLPWWQRLRWVCECVCVCVCVCVRACIQCLCACWCSFVWVKPLKQSLIPAGWLKPGAGQTGRRERPSLLFSSLLFSSLLFSSLLSSLLSLDFSFSSHIPILLSLFLLTFDILPPCCPLSLSFSLFSSLCLSTSFLAFLAYFSIPFPSFSPCPLLLGPFLSILFLFTFLFSISLVLLPSFSLHPIPLMLPCFTFTFIFLSIHAFSLPPSLSPLLHCFLYSSPILSFPLPLSSLNSSPPFLHALLSSLPVPFSILSSFSRHFINSIYHPSLLFVLPSPPVFSPSLLCSPLLSSRRAWSSLTMTKRVRKEGQYLEICAEAICRKRVIEIGSRGRERSPHPSRLTGA